MSGGKIKKEYTCFVYSDRDDGSEELIYVPASEWFRRLRRDAGLKGDARRYYKTDSFLEDGVLHVLVEEVSREEYKRWNSAHTSYLNDFVNAKRAYQFVSLSDPLPGSDGELRYEDVIPDYEADTRELGETNLAVEEFRSRVKNQPPWMEDVMNLVRYGYERDCDVWLREKRGVTDRTVRNYKAGYRKFAESFVKEWLNSDKIET